MVTLPFLYDGKTNSIKRQSVKVVSLIVKGKRGRYAIQYSNL